MSDDRVRAIRDYLTRRRDALVDEVNSYPTPIARCDVQLPALLEARAEVIALLRCDDDALVAGFAEIAERLDDPEARRLKALARPVHARA